MIFLWLVTMLLSCQRQPNLLIESISKESNEAFLTGKNLDPRLYSTKIAFQYYQIKGYTHLPAKDIAFKLDSFVKLRYPLKENRHRKSLTIWFYRKQLYSDYDDVVYESARESENGSLIGHPEDIVALLELEFQANGERTLIKHICVYHPERGEPLVKLDTVNMK